MSRNLTADYLAAITAAALRPVRFFEGDFTGGTLRLWTGLAPIDWNGQTWTGAGNLLAMSAIQETAELRASGFTVTLSGLNPSIIGLALGQARQGLTGRVWEGALTADGAVIADPFLSYEGKLDVPDIANDGESCTVSISYEGRLISLERVRERRITHEDQQIEYPGDRGHEYNAGLQDKQVVW